MVRLVVLLKYYCLHTVRLAMHMHTTTTLWIMDMIIRVVLVYCYAYYAYSMHTLVWRTTLRCSDLLSSDVAYEISQKNSEDTSGPGEDCVRIFCVVQPCFWVLIDRRPRAGSVEAKDKGWSSWRKMPVAGYWTLAKKGEVNKIMMKKCITRVCNMHTEVCAGLYSCTNFLTFEY